MDVGENRQATADRGMDVIADKLAARLAGRIAPQGDAEHVMTRAEVVALHGEPRDCTRPQPAILCARASAAGHAEAAQRLLDQADTERRDLNASEARAYDRHSAAAAELEALEDAYGARDRRSAETFARIKAQPVVRRHAGGGESALADEFRHRIRTNSREPIEIRWEDGRSGYQPGLERRDLLTTSGGGLTGTTFHNQLVQHMVEGSAILAAGATLLTTETGEDLAIPKTTAMSSAAIVAEGATIGESDPTLATVTLGAYKYAFLVQITNELANDNGFDLVSYLARQAGEAIANGAGADFMAGTGTGEPSGLVGAATVGVTGATGASGAFTAEDLIDLQTSLAEPYARSSSAAWLMSNATLGNVRKLRDDSGASAGTGGFLFDVTPPPGTGAAGTLLGKPVYLDPNVPAVGVGAKSVLFGDISRYWVRSVRSMTFARSDDFAFDKDVVTFRALWRADGALIDTTGSVKAFQGGAS